MDRKAVILADPNTQLPAKLELNVRESASQPNRLKMTFTVEAEVDGKTVKAPIQPEWRVELN